MVTGGRCIRLCVLLLLNYRRIFSKFVIRTGLAPILLTWVEMDLHHNVYITSPDFFIISKDKNLTNTKQLYFNLFLWSERSRTSCLCCTAFSKPLLDLQILIIVTKLIILILWQDLNLYLWPREPGVANYITQ